MTDIKQTGFTLIEVLIAMLILAVGLLGMASLTMNSLQANQGASMRSQASALAADFAERLRTNRDFAISNGSAYLLSSSTSAASNPSCASGSSGCSSADQAQSDMYQWRNQLGTSMPGASATITKPGAQRYDLVITWSEAGAGTPVSTDFTLRIDL